MLTNATLRTPRGTYENTIQFRFDIPGVADEEYEYAFVPGIGFARWTNMWSGPRVLTEYEMGPL